MTRHGLRSPDRLGFLLLVLVDLPTFILAALFSSPSHAARHLTPEPPIGPAYRVSCNSCASAEVVELLYRDVLQVPYVIGEGVEADRRAVTVNIVGTAAELVRQAGDYLEGLGYVDQVHGRVHSVSLRPPPVPMPPPEKPKPRLYPYVYRPAWRSAPELAQELAPLFPDGRFSAGAPTAAFQPPPSDADDGPYRGGGGGAGAGGYGGRYSSTAPVAAVTPPSGSSAPDTLVFLGTVQDLLRLQAMLPDVDTPEAQVMVKAAVFEVDTSTSDGSALNLAVGLLRQRLQVGINANPTLSASPVGAVSGGLAGLSGNVLSISDGNVDAVVTALSANQRFHLLTSPAALARSGGSASLQVGDQVPVLANVSYAGASGTAVQSVDYKSSGVILTVRPVVHERVIDLDLHQEISSFVQTTSGVNNTPTLQNRTLDTSVAIRDGDCIAMGGLTQTNRGRSRSGLPWPLAFLGSSEVTGSRTDVLMIVQVVRVNARDGGPTPTEAADRQRLPAVGGPPIEATR